MKTQLREQMEEINENTGKPNIIAKVQRNSFDQNISLKFKVEENISIKQSLHDDKVYIKLAFFIPITKIAK